MVFETEETLETLETEGKMLSTVVRDFAFVSLVFFYPFCPNVRLNALSPSKYLTRVTSACHSSNLTCHSVKKMRRRLAYLTENSYICEYEKY